MSRARRFAPERVQPLLFLSLMLSTATSTSAQTGSAALPDPLRRPESSRSTPTQRASATRDKASAKEAEARRSVGMVLEALRANTLVAPYPIMVSWQNNRVLLSGKVGTKEVYDLTVRTMIDSGIPFRESLVIDTAETYRVAQAATMNAGNPATDLSQGTTALPYIYPPPLFGRVDDPFFGLEPPASSFPPTWSRRSSNRNDPSSKAASPPMAGDTSVASRSVGTPPPSADMPAVGKAQISVDEFGRVYLRGEVASEQIRNILEQEAGTVPGVTQVINELTIENASGGSDAPPPPPQPHPPADAVKLDEKTTNVPRSDSKPLSDRVADSLIKRPVEGQSPVKVTITGNTVTLSGKVASAYEAMLAFRAAQQTPGVREVVDQLEFPMPEEDASNPLLQKGRPEDVQPYLEDQIRRNLGETAHVDRVEVRGNILEIHGSVANRDDQKRLTAILRSIPILRGFQIESKFPLN